MSEVTKDKLTKSAKDMSAEEAAKLKTLETALAKIEKTYGKGAVMNMGARPVTDVSVIPSGSITLDNALGVGGYPRGRIIEIYGPESSGKTTLAIHAIAEAQKLGGKAIIIDAEHAFDPTYAEALGVDMDNLYISQPDNGEQALDLTRVKVVKNKVAPPFRVALFEILYGQGISRLGEIIDLGESEDLIKKSGSWYSYGATKLGQGKEKAKETLADNPELLEELTQKITERLKNASSAKDKRKKKSTKDEDEDED